MQLKSRVQSEDDKVRDRVHAMMETGNHGQARTLMRELKAVNEELAQSLRITVLHEYGVSL